MHSQILGPGPEPSPENAGATGAHLESGQVCLPAWLPSLKRSLQSPSELCRQDYNRTLIALQTQCYNNKLGLVLKVPFLTSEHGKAASLGSHSWDDFIKLKDCTAHAHSLVLLPTPIFCFKPGPA